MNATFSNLGSKLLCQRELAQPYWPRMVTARQVQVALRELLGKTTPEDFADEARVDRATVYRILGAKAYRPRIETVAALAEARGLTLSQFFARIEGSDLLRHSPDQLSDLPGGPNVPASERDRLSQLEADIAALKAQWGDVQNVASRLFQLAVAGAESRDAPDQQTSRRRVAGKTRR